VKDLIEYFRNKKNLINLLILLVVIVTLPFIGEAIKYSKIFSSRAAADPIVFTGPNIVTVNNQRTLKLNDQGQAVVDLELTSPLGPPRPATASAKYQTELAQSGGLLMSLLPEGGIIKEAYAIHGSEWSCEWEDSTNTCWCLDNDVWVVEPDTSWCHAPIQSTCDPFDGNGDAEYTKFERCESCNQEIWSCNVSPFSEYNFGNATGSCSGTNLCGGGYTQSSYGGDTCPDNPSSNSHCFIKPYAGNCDQATADLYCANAFGSGSTCDSTTSFGDNYGGCTQPNQLLACTLENYSECYVAGQCPFPAPLGGNDDQFCRNKYGNQNMECFALNPFGDGCYLFDNTTNLCIAEGHSCSLDIPNTSGYRYGVCDENLDCVDGSTLQCPLLNQLEPWLCLDDEQTSQQVRWCYPGGVFLPDACQELSEFGCFDDAAGTTASVECVFNNYVEASACAVDPSICSGNTPVCSPQVEAGVTDANGCKATGTTTATCSLKVNGVEMAVGNNPPQNNITVAQGTPVNFEITASPPGATAVWNGQGTATSPTGNLLNDPVQGYAPTAGQTSYTWTAPYNLPQGTYTRIVSIKNAAGVDICTTGIATIQVGASTNAPMLNVRNIARSSDNTQGTQANPFAVGTQVTISHQATNTTHTDIHYINATTFPNPDMNSAAPAIKEGQAPNQPFTWTIPSNLTPGKYWLVLNVHKEGTTHTGLDWSYSGEGCAWDGHFYFRAQPGSTTLTDGGACLNAGKMEFWVGTPLNCGQHAVCPSNPAICSNNPQCQGGGCTVAGQTRCADGVCRVSCGQGGYTQASYTGYTQASYTNACPTGQTRCTDGVCRTSCAGYTQASYTGGYTQASYTGGYTQSTYTGGYTQAAYTGGYTQASYTGGYTQASYTVNTPPPTPAGVYTVSYKIAEDPVALNNAPIRPYNTEPIRITPFIFANPNPGIKNIWVEYIASNGQTQRRTASITVLGPDPGVTGCNISDSTQASVTFNIIGNNFGTEAGIIRVGNTNLTINSWTNTAIKATYNNPPAGQAFPFNLTIKDGRVTQGQCSAVSQLFLGAKLFCRQPGKFDVTDVKLTLAEQTNAGRLIREVVTIDKNGVVQGLRSRLEEGKGYKLGIEAPKSVRRVVDFTAAAGATNIPNLTLPIGDIFPVPAGDGSINTPDKSEQNREWVIATDAQNRPADFNQDARVNSVDWACMRFDFGKTDEAEPTAGASVAPSASPAASASPVGQTCVQVITPALNPQTGACQEFPTPCDVPSGWTRVDSC
jgi:hypothetical protein